MVNMHKRTFFNYIYVLDKIQKSKTTKQHIAAKHSFWQSGKLNYAIRSDISGRSAKLNKNERLERYEKAIK